MPRKPMAEITPQQFLYLIKQAGLSHAKESATIIGRAASTAARYARGSLPIPVEVAEKLGEYIALLAQSQSTSLQLRLAARLRMPAVHRSPVQGNSPTQGRMLGNLKESHRTYPGKRFTASQYLLLREALKAWRIETHKRQKLADAIRLREIGIELTNLKALYELFPPWREAQLTRYVPLSHMEWKTLSRALRFYAQTDSRAGSLYLTLRTRLHEKKYLRPGYPRDETYTAV